MGRGSFALIVCLIISTSSLSYAEEAGIPHVFAPGLGDLHFHEGTYRLNTEGHYGTSAEDDFKSEMGSIKYNLGYGFSNSRGVNISFDYSRLQGNSDGDTLVHNQQAFMAVIDFVQELGVDGDAERADYKRTVKAPDWSAVIGFGYLGLDESVTTTKFMEEMSIKAYFARIGLQLEYPLPYAGLTLIPHVAYGVILGGDLEASYAASPDWATVSIAEKLDTSKGSFRTGCDIRFAISEGVELLASAVIDDFEQLIKSDKDNFRLLGGLRMGEDIFRRK